MRVWLKRLQYMKKGCLFLDCWKAFLPNIFKLFQVFAKYLTFASVGLQNAVKFQVKGGLVVHLQWTMTHNLLHRNDFGICLLNISIDWPCTPGFHSGVQEKPAPPQSCKVSIFAKKYLLLKFYQTVLILYQV